MTRSLLEWAAVALVLAVAVVALYPNAVLRPDEPATVPTDVIKRLPEQLDNGDLDEFCRYMNLSAEAVRHGRIYFPVSDFDCPVSFLFPAGAVRAATGWPPVRVLNYFTLVALWLGGLAAYGFVREVGAAGPVAAVAAVGLVGANYLATHHHRGHMHNVQLVWMGSAFWSLARLCRPRATWRPAAGLGLAMGGQLLSSPSYSVYLGYVGLPAFAVAWWLTRHRQTGVTRAEVTRFLLSLVGAIALSAFVASFYLVPRLSNPPVVYPAPVFMPWVIDKFIDFVEPAHPTLFVGFPLIVLGVLAVNWCVRQPRPETVAMTSTLAASAVMTLPAVPGTPYWVLYHVMPMVDHVRVPIRFFPIGLLMLLGLVAVHLTACTDGKRPAARWLTAGGLFVALVAGNWLISPWFYGPGGRILGP